jgi:hydrogenase maturation protein HypF
MAMVAQRLLLSGRVQGVGFRPFVYRLAHRVGVRGRVWNALGQVTIEVQGTREQIGEFARELVNAAPPLARPLIERTEDIDPDAGLEGFAIVASDAGGTAQVHVPPDQFACDDCLAELADPTDRRYRYAFINCTQCGPRYTLIERLPYDRANTTMARFALCDACRREYLDPRDRRYHAEPLACPICGPQLELVAADPAAPQPDTVNGGARAAADDVLARAVAALRAGATLAVKGIGGYHLMCDARSAAAVARLRARKQRPDKPLAVMYPRSLGGADPLSGLRGDVRVTDAEAAALLCAVRPIVIVRRAPGCTLAPGVAPGLDEIGVFLPYSPLHEMLLGDFAGPLVATSGNLSGEPVITDPAMAQSRLAGLADAFLHHDRPICRPADDPVCRSVAGRVRPLRLGRGSAPLELELPWSFAVPTLAVGAQLKNCVALGWGHRVVVSPHIGSMGSPRSLEVFEHVVRDLQALYRVTAERVACDAHPGYATTRWAQRCGLPMVRTWHHEAHASAVHAEANPAGRMLVFSWDGVGLGRDGRLWGGEAFVGCPGAWRRVASLREFRLPGGDRAARDPWRTAASLCWHEGLDWAVAGENRDALRHAWQRGLNSPWTSSAGRLFDAAAALVLGIERTSHEAQAPMLLEASAAGDAGLEPLALPWSADSQGLLRLDWSALLQPLRDAARPAAARAALFHESLALAIHDLARRLAGTEQFESIGLAGGVFQNRRLTESCQRRLLSLGLPVVVPERLPANDAAIALGQLLESAGGAAPC